MQHYTIKEIKKPNGQVLYAVTNNPDDKRECRHVFESKADAEHRKRRLNAHGEYRSI